MTPFCFCSRVVRHNYANYSVQASVQLFTDVNYGRIYGCTQASTSYATITAPCHSTELRVSAAVRPQLFFYNVTFLVFFFGWSFKSTTVFSARNSFITDDHAKYKMSFNLLIYSSPPALFVSTFFSFRH